MSSSYVYLLVGSADDDDDDHGVDGGVLDFVFATNFHVYIASIAALVCIPLCTRHHHHDDHHHHHHHSVACQSFKRLFFVQFHLDLVQGEKN